jgi:hypothetical protein
MPLLLKFVAVLALVALLPAVANRLRKHGQFALGAATINTCRPSNSTAKGFIFGMAVIP